MSLTKILPVIGSLLLMTCILSSTAFGGDLPQFGVRSETVRVPVVVVDKEGKLYDGLQKENFQILEEGVPQEITNFTGGQSPLTLVILVENSRPTQYLLQEILQPVANFITRTLEAEDYAALIAFDSRPRILCDFTRNRGQLLNGLYQLTTDPVVSYERSLFDALKFVLEGGVLDQVEYRGLAEVEGRTAVLLLSTGINSLSRTGFKEIRKIAANAGVPIYAIGIGELEYIRIEPHLGSFQRMTFLQAQNHLKTFSSESGGHFYSIRFIGALGNILESITAMLRFQYTLGYRTRWNEDLPAKRQIKVLVDLDGDQHPDNDRLDLNYRRYCYLADSGKGGNG